MVDTVAAQEKDIESLHQHINGLKNKGNPNLRDGTNAGGGTAGNRCPHCAAIERSAPHKKGSCYFDPKKMTERREWACTLTDEKGVAFKDDD